MAGNVMQLHRFADDVGPLPLVLLDQNYDALTLAVNTLNTYSNFYTDLGTTNAITLQTPGTQTVAYGDGLVVMTRVAATNTGPTTLNVNNLGALPVLNPNGTQFTGGELLAGTIYNFVFNTARNAWQIGGDGGGGGQVTAPFSVANLSGQSALTINPDGTGYLGDFNGNGLSWDAACHFNFDGGATLSGINAPFTVSGPNGEPLFTVNTPVAGSGDCLVVIGPGDAGAIQSGPTLCLNGMVNYPVLKVWAANATVPEVYVAEFAAGDSCTPGFSNGVWIAAGSSASDFALIVENCAAANDPPNRQQFFQLAGDGSGALGPDPNRLVWDAAGHFSLTGTATLPMPPLIDLPGISITNPQNGEALVYDSANNQWVNGAPVNALATLNDVTLTSPANGQSLVYNAGKWVNAVVPLTLEQLTNTHVSGPAPGQVLTYSLNPLPGWVNATIPGYNFLTNLGVGANPQAGWVLTWDGSAWVGAAPGQVAQFPLSSLTDVGITTPLNRQVLTYDAPSGKWINAPAPSPSLATLPDVALTSQTQGQVLSWNATALRWENASLPGGSVIALDTLMDTNISDPQNNQVLTWDYASSRWVNRALPTVAIPALATLPDVSLTAPTNGQVLVYNAANQHWVNGSGVQGLFTINAAGAGIPTANIANIGMGIGVGLSGSGDNLYTNGNYDFAFGTTGTGALKVYTNGSERVAISNTGNIVVNAASSGSGDTLTVSAGAGQSAITAMNPSGANALSTQGAVQFYTDAWVPSFYIDGNGVGFLGGPSIGSRSLSWNATGNFNVNVPTTGPALTVVGNGYPNIILAAASGVGPTLSWQQLGRTQWQALNDGGTDSWRLWNENSGTVLSASNTGNVSVQIPSSGTALTVQGAANTAAMVVNSNGNTQVASQNWCLALSSVNAAPGASYGLSIRAGTISGASSRDIPFQIMTVSGSFVMYTYGTGEVYFPLIPTVSASAAGNVIRIVGGTGQLTWDPSARRYKSNIRSLAREKAKELVEKLRVVTYRSKSKLDDPNVTHYGLIAEEVAEVAPGLVALDGDGKPSGVQMDHLAMLLIPLVQELLGMDEPEGEVYG